ncbi:hypothetical protein DERP_000321 [Dermatophagoides pteronyssinus]|uniref:Uncharacterized protein n=1 Tax=Dermatophagoides pteronyssinus TaxID=6956 RepID=A0ABQ8J014_DERPT|nr:hypothetical protein DERP_000321 [Dermatophagoides pteronyssinus]
MRKRFSKDPTAIRRKFTTSRLAGPYKPGNMTHVHNTQALTLHQAIQAKAFLCSCIPYSCFPQYQS